MIPVVPFISTMAMALHRCVDQMILDQRQELNDRQNGE